MSVATNCSAGGQDPVMSTRRFMSGAGLDPVMSSRRVRSEGGPEQVISASVPRAIRRGPHNCEWVMSKKGDARPDAQNATICAGEATVAGMPHLGVAVQRWPGPQCTTQQQPASGQVLPGAQ